MRQFGTGRKDIKDGLGKVKDVPSVVYGKVTFDTTTRRVADPIVSRLEVKGGKFVAWDGKLPVAR
jgi:branched-chain amino acid transport system substrate-binding protein